jgi:membrane protease YdiL (CAAX protease family)
LKWLIKNSAIGLALGFIWILGSIALLYFAGSFHLGTTNEVPYIPIWFFAVLLNAAMQEYLVRGYLFSLFREKYNVIVATAITTVLFTLMHAGAFAAGFIAILNVITMSVFVTLLLIYTQSLLAPVLVHFIWNSVGCLIFGVVSLSDDYPNILNSVLTGSDLLSGGTAKIEGSIVVSIVNAILILFMVFLLNKNKNSIRA